MFIANNSIFEWIMQYFFSQINCAEGVLPNDEFRKKINGTGFKNIRKNVNLMVKPLQNVIFLEGRLPKYFFRKYVPLVVSKLYTKFQQLSLSKTAILKNP